MKKPHFELRTLIVLALFTAIGALFKAFISVDLFFGGLKISDVSLIALPVMLAGIYYGPLAGGIVGFAAELAGYFLTPTGAYNPAFSAVMALTGVIAGLFWLRGGRVMLVKTVIMVSLAELLCAVIINTVIIHLFYGVAYEVLLPTRLIGALIKIPLLTAFLVLLADRLRPALKRKT